jgi:NAD(P)-dependent dehydrogenase (short-subunit alcohol dehydrogenase family)
MDIKGKICLITGATSGIGKQTAIDLAKKGAKIVFTSRDAEKGFITKNDIIRLSGNEDVEMMLCDLASFSSIKTFADNFKSKYNQLHFLINNAGTWQTSRKLSTDGIELTLATNTLAPFLLTHLLLDLLKRSNSARIINVASHAHKFAKLDFDNLEGNKQFNHFQIYGQSKIILILLTNKLSENLKEFGITVNSLHPGVVSTHLFDNMGNLAKSAFKLFMISPEKGAQTTIYLATSVDVSNISGKYFARKKIVSATKAATDKSNADKIWQISTDYVEKYLQ